MFGRLERKSDWFNKPERLKKHIQVKYLCMKCATDQQNSVCSRKVEDLTKDAFVHQNNDNNQTSKMIPRRLTVFPHAECNLESLCSQWKQQI